MAASTANMVKSKSGKMYEASSPQGKMIVTAATTGKDADFDTGSSTKEDAPETMLATLQAIYEETQESGDTLDDIEGLLDDDDNPLDDARKNLKASNKDKRKSKIVAGIQSAYGGVKSAGTKVKKTLAGNVGLALLGSGLLLLNQYGEEIAGPDGWLTKFLKYMKQEFIPDIKALYETIAGDGGLISDLKKGWDDTWLQLTGILKFFSEIGTTIKTYVKKFDTNNDGILSGDEAKVMWEEIWDSIKDSLWTLTKDSAIALVSAIGLISIGKAALVTLFTSGAGLTPLAAGAGALAGFGTLGTLALVGVVAAGLWFLTERLSGAYKDAITDEAGKPQNFKVKEFLARFFGGNDDEGGFFNSLTTGVKSAISGGAIGAAIGSTVPGVGTVVGAAVGALIFGVIGVVGGAAGKTKIERWLSEFELNFIEARDSLFTFFDRIVTAAKAAVTPDVTVSEALKSFDSMKNVQPGLEGGQQNINNARRAAQERIAKAQQRIAELRGKFYYNNGSVQAGIDIREIKGLQASIQADYGDIQRMGPYVETEADASAAANEASFQTTMDSVKNNLQSSITSVSSLGFRATNFALKELPSSIGDISAQDLHRFAFEGSMFERDFKSEAERELAAAQAAGYALGGDIPGSEGKGNLADYRIMIAMAKEKFKDGNMPRVTTQMAAMMNAKLLKREIRADAAKENKFTTYTSQDRRTSTEINQANFVDSINARNEFWQEYYMHKAATN